MAKINTEIDLNDVNQISFDYTGLTKNLNSITLEIKTKITNADIKLTSLKNKEDILNKMITTTNMQMENTPKENFKLIGIYQKTIIEQLESLNLLQESIIKFEDLIQRYLKMKMDIENNKLNAYSKIKSLNKADQETESDYNGLMKNLHSLLSNPQGVLDMKEEAKEQLRISGY